MILGVVTGRGDGSSRVVHIPFANSRPGLIDMVDSSSLHLCHVARFWGCLGLIVPILFPNFVRNKSIENNAFEHSAYTVRCFSEMCTWNPFARRERAACAYWIGREPVTRISTSRFALCCQSGCDGT